MSDRPTADADRREQVSYLAKRLKIPSREADRLLANAEAGERGEAA